MTENNEEPLEVQERAFMERSMLATKTIIHVGERPVPCERSFDASFSFFFTFIYL